MNTTVIKKLPRAWSVGGAKVTEIELREATIADLMEAEKDGDPQTNPYTFKIALAAATMVRAGTYTGPFTTGMFRTMSSANFMTIAVGLLEAEALGEDEQPSQAPNP